jgi:hypothetical protein
MHTTTINQMGLDFAESKRTLRRLMKLGIRFHLAGPSLQNRYNPSITHC